MIVKDVAMADRLMYYMQYLDLYDKWREDGDFSPSEAMVSLYREAQWAVVWRAKRTSRWEEALERPFTGHFFTAEQMEIVRKREKDEPLG